MTTTFTETVHREASAPHAADPRRRSRRRGTAVVGLAVCFAGSPRPLRSQEEAGSVDAARLNATVRAALEPEYRRRSGTGFQSLDCDSNAPLRPGTFLDCDALLESGNPMHLVLAIDDQGRSEVVLASRPASALDALERAEVAALEPACQTFLNAYAGADWDAAYSTLRPEAREEVSPEGFRAGLARVRDALGPVHSTELLSYGRRSPEGKELEYRLDCENGAAQARFRVHLEAEASGLLAYRVGPEVGSPIEGALLEAAFRDHLASTIGQAVTGLELRFDQLSRVGEATQGRALLEGGGDFPFRLELIRRHDDFDTDNYAIQALDAPFLIERYLASRSESAASATCPNRVVPDGGSEVCEATLADGSRLAITLARRGGEHTLTDARSLSEPPAGGELGRLAVPENEEILVRQFADSLGTLLGDSQPADERLELVRMTVRAVRRHFETLAVGELAARAPRLPGLELPDSGEPLPLIVLRHLTCGVAVTLRAQEGEAGTPARLEAARALVAHSSAAAFVSARFGQGGGQLEELEALISSEAAERVAVKLQEDPALRESASVECRAVAAALVN